MSFGLGANVSTAIRQARCGSTGTSKSSGSQYMFIMTCKSASPPNQAIVHRRLIQRDGNALTWRFQVHASDDLFELALVASCNPCRHRNSGCVAVDRQHRQQLACRHIVDVQEDNDKVGSGLLDAREPTRDRFHVNDVKGGRIGQQLVQECRALWTFADGDDAPMRMARDRTFTGLLRTSHGELLLVPGNAEAKMVPRRNAAAGRKRVVVVVASRHLPAG